MAPWWLIGWGCSKPARFGRIMALAKAALHAFAHADLIEEEIQRGLALAIFVVEGDLAIVVALAYPVGADARKDL